MFLCIEIKHPLKLKSVLSLVINNKKVHYSTTEILYMTLLFRDLNVFYLNSTRNTTSLPVNNPIYEHEMNPQEFEGSI